MIDGMQAAHEGSWAFVVILFVLSYLFANVKVLPMILRLFYVIMIFSGGYMLFSYGFPLHFVIKAILAIVAIGLMEATLGKKKRGEKAVGLFVAVIVVLLLVVLLGYGVLG
ncbi:DUF1516 family protein [Aureibacillus halotolerans]|uniref:Uncharacterized protein DUF1516 n=1 Tax=Aureibacillus halotolerans TaxID=1508390 RepID=A0A4R6TZH1_9BACI|nr:DUF1516 family protein [Aureibacillus halotolerans]TDQ37469.1 uncharacterized protein DUF1516 [Aureibacillus halotolerans]